MGDPLRIGNASGFYGDRFAAVAEMLADGPLDVVTGDYLAELTMLILGRDRARDPSLGYARTFLRQLRESLAVALDRGVRVVANAGGLNPAGLADAIRELAADQHLDVAVGHVTGDDLAERAVELGLGEVLTANAYLGSFGIAECLRAGADVVVTGRVTDVALTVGPAIAAFDWTPDDHDALAGAVVAGHVIECGAQATGGNFSFFTELDVGHPGFPIAEVAPDGTSVITKHPGTGGAVTVETVTAQLLYEIAGPRYPTPDVTARFDTIALTDDGADRVSISGVVGEPPPSRSKVATTRLAGHRNEVTFVLTGLDVEAKAALVRRQLAAALVDRLPDRTTWTLARTDHADADTEQAASALLRCQVFDDDPEVVGRAFSSAAVELALASIPGFFVTAPPSSPSPVGIYAPAFVDRDVVEHVAVLPDGSRHVVPPPAHTDEREPGTRPDVAEQVAAAAVVSVDGPRRRAPLGRVFGARSGDKGGDANLGVWARDELGWSVLVTELDVATLRDLLPEVAGLPVTRHVLSNLRAVNFLIEGLLDEGVASASRFDPQAKGLGEWLRSREMELPIALFGEAPVARDGP